MEQSRLCPRKGMSLFLHEILITLLLASTASTGVSGTCSATSCLNNGLCVDDSGTDVCHCPLVYVGDRCQFEVSPITTSVCMASSSTLNGDVCSQAVDTPGNLITALQTEWVADGSEDGVGAFIIVKLMQLYSVIGIKYRQRCDPQNQIQSMAVALNDGTVVAKQLTCSVTSDCTDQSGGTILYDHAIHDTSLVKIVIMSLCNNSTSADVGFRDITVFTVVDECSEGTPCQNSGACIEQDLGYICNCDGTGFEGENCEQNIDDCVGLTCINGVCVDMVNGAYCDCDAGFNGNNCEINIDECVSNGCVHGPCNDLVDGYSCTCDSGYTGEMCDQDIDDCSPDPCDHGTCLDQINGFQCICDTGYEDDTCSTNIDDCSPDPCVHGTCMDDVDGYTCNCQLGYEGMNCSTNIDECVNIICDNGGSCVDLINGYKCLCADGVERHMCTDPEDLECKCSIDGATNELEVFDHPDLQVYSKGQKTILSSYRLFQNHPCKFKFQVVTRGGATPAPVGAITFNIGQHPGNRNKTGRSYKMFDQYVNARGHKTKAQVTKRVNLPREWSSRDNKTKIMIERQGDIIQFRSSTCWYALDVDASKQRLSATLYVSRRLNGELMGMCGDCNRQRNKYRLRDGTSVFHVDDLKERYKLITNSYKDGNKGS